MNFHQLRLRLERILARSETWDLWQEAVEAFLQRGRLGPGVVQISCYDTHELVDYILPHSLTPRGGGYPSLGDLSHLLVFGRGDRGDGPEPEAAAAERFWLLPAHFYELEKQREVWRDNVRRLASNLDLLKDVAQRLGQIDAGSEEEIGHFVDDLVRNNTFFVQAFRLRDGRMALGSLLARLSSLRSDDLALLDGWKYQPQEDLLEAWFARVRSYEAAVGGLWSHRIDAHALLQLEQVNGHVGPEVVVVLKTTSRKIWTAVAKRRQEDPEALTKLGISLVQSPLDALVQEMSRRASEAGESEAFDEQLRREVAHKETLRELRERLRNDKLPVLRRLERSKRRERGSAAAEREDLSLLRSQIEALEQAAEQLESFALDRRRLESLRLPIHPFAGGWADMLRKIRDLLSGHPAVLRERLEGLLGDMEEVQRKLALSSPAAPEDFALYGEPPPRSRLRGILIEQPHGEALAVHFVSEPIRGAVRSLYEAWRRFHQLKSGGGDEAAVAAARLELQSEVSRAETGLHGEVEHDLFLAALFCSRRHWRSAYEVAAEGLRRLWPTGIEAVDPIGASPSAPPPLPPADIASATVELLLVKAFAGTYLTLRERAARPERARAFFAEAIEAIVRSMSLRRHWDSVLPPAPADDPRALRLLGTLYGTSHEMKLELPAAPEVLALAGLEAGDGRGEPSLLDVYEALARLAYEAAERRGQLSAPYENSYLYALTLQGRERDLPLRLEIAERLRARGAAGAETDEAVDANILDTLAWHLHELSGRDGGARSRRHLRHQARELIEEANRKAEEDDSYYAPLIRRHHGIIVSPILAPEGEG